MIDNRAAGGTLFEGATVMCAHCQNMWIRNPLRTRPRGYCAKCDAYVCDSPICRADCRPFWKMIEKEQTKAEHAIINRILTGADHG